MANACDNVNVLRVSYYIKLLLKYVFILIPIVLIAFVSFDLFKSVVAKDDSEMKDNLHLIIRRLMYAIVLFLVPSVVSFFMRNFVDGNVPYYKCLNADIYAIQSQVKKNERECISSGNTWDDSSNECILKSEILNKKISTSDSKLIMRNSSDKEDSDETTTKKLKGKDNKEKTWIFLRNKGLSKAGAAGVMGNLQQEHGFHTSDVGSGLGIVQWIGSRRSNCITYAKKKGKKYTSLSVQLEFLWKELKNYKSLLKTLKNTKSVSKATTRFCKEFERPGDPRLSKRIENAEEFYKKYKNAN